MKKNTSVFEANFRSITVRWMQCNMFQHYNILNISSYLRPDWPMCKLISINCILLSVHLWLWLLVDRLTTVTCKRVTGRWHSPVRWITSCLCAVFNKSRGILLWSDWFWSAFVQSDHQLPPWSIPWQKLNSPSDQPRECPKSHVLRRQLLL